jgi:hypothetical protein
MANKQVVIDHIMPTAIIAARDTRHCGDSMPPVDNIVAYT